LPINLLKSKLRSSNPFRKANLLPWQHPLKNQKKHNDVSKPLHLSTNPEILVKIAPLVSELRGLEIRPLKKINKNKGKTSVKYIALPASLPSGLNYCFQLESVICIYCCNIQ